MRGVNPHRRRLVMRGRLALWLSSSLVFSVAACSDSAEEVEIDVRPPTSPPDARPLPPTTSTTTQDTRPARLEIEVNLRNRELHVQRDGVVAETYPIAVGSDEWPTPTGEWTIEEVVWNPRWTPPDEEWAVDEVGREPGDPRNPLGKAQLVYDRLGSIHGTSDSSSLGKAVSHRSIRVADPVAVDLARQVMEAGGAERDDAWFRRVQENPREEFRVPLPNPVTIRVLSRTPSPSPT
jgi:lipoprotein-anchoring transpeptidase ErfK/SrfK